MIPADQALHRLHLGNRRFVANTRERVNGATGFARESLVAGQSPFAIVLACTDSRVPPEIVFDQGLGDLFVVRVAGNVVSSTQLGSIEYAAAHLGVRLVVVLGHSNCGAIQVALDTLANPDNVRSSPNIDSLLELILPVVKPLAAKVSGENPGDLLRQAARANVLASISRIRSGSGLLENLIRNEGLRIAGADYCLASGEVDFFEEIPVAE